MKSDFQHTPSQTVGPFFHLCLTTKQELGRLTAENTPGQRIRLMLRVTDGDGAPVNDAMIELWQADSSGNYSVGAGAPFSGFGRLCTDEAGVAMFETIKPGVVVDPDVGRQASHVNVMIFARGLLKQLVTRIYFQGETENDADPVLAAVPVDRRSTLMATRCSESPDTWALDIRLSGESETVFFDV